MREVTASRDTEASRADVLEALSPEAIVEAGTYEVQSTETTEDGWLLTVAQADVEMTLSFRAVDNGFVYEQRGDTGPFKEMYTSVTVTGDDTGTLTARSCFTFGSFWSFALDRLAARDRKLELKRLLANLVVEIDGIEPHVPSDG